MLAGPYGQIRSQAPSVRDETNWKGWIDDFSMYRAPLRRAFGPPGALLLYTATGYEQPRAPIGYSTYGLLAYYTHSYWI